jgi:hypothetical protein
MKKSLLFHVGCISRKTAGKLLASHCAQPPGTDAMFLKNIFANKKMAKNGVFVQNKNC